MNNITNCCWEEKLSFKEMDTKGFESYLKEHNNTFDSILNDNYCITEKKNVTDNYGNTVLKINNEFKDDTSKFIYFQNRKCFEDLTNAIQSSGELFAIIDNKIRGTPTEDVLHNDIEMLVNLLKWGAEQSVIKSSIHKKGYPQQIVFMTDESPLCGIGLAIKHLVMGGMVFIVADVNVAVLCSLFVELCHKAGIPPLCLILLMGDTTINITPIKWYNQQKPLKMVKVDDKGSAAVVTEFADVDSAVDILLYATTNKLYPWMLRRVFVQENTLKKFENALRHRINQKSEENMLYASFNTDSLIQVIETKRYKKIFINDFAGLYDDIPKDAPVVLVEPYRTTKEVLGLIDAAECPYLSVWCTNMSVANEIAFGTRVLNVWLNDYADFDNEFGVMNFFYSNLTPSCLVPEKYTAKLYTKDIINALSKPSNVWRNLSVEKRKAVILDACLELDCIYTISTIQKIVTNFSQMVGSIVNGKMYQRFYEPVGILHINKIQSLNTFIHLLLIGNTLVYNNEEKIPDDILTELLIKSGVPIKAYNKYEVPGCLFDLETVALEVLNNGDLMAKVVNIDNWSHFKTICSYFGETFAN